MIIPDIYRPVPNYPTYPPYHQGLYLEEYFYERFKGKTFNRTYIPIFWTNLYCNGSQVNIQNILNRLDPNGKYFTVCQHDDAPRERLPADTMIFSSGGHFVDKSLIPLPSICSKILNPILDKPRDIFASFVGSLTSPLRDRMVSQLQNDQKYVLNTQQWTPSVPMSKFEKFKDITERSKFCLCPRGYGRSSFRMYEAMQLGAIPVYISDEFFLPFSEKINWDDLCVTVHEKNIPDLDAILRGLSEYQCDRMRNYAKEISEQYFSLDGVCRQIEFML